MIKFENNRATLEGSGEKLLEEYAKITHAIKTAFIRADEESDEDFANYLLFVAFKGGLDAPLNAASDGKNAEDKPEKKDDGDGTDDFIKFLDNLIDSIKKGD